MHLVRLLRAVGSCFLVSVILWTATALAAPEFLEDRFELPSGFRIYRAATAELSGGSYALTFDGEGRLLVGDGTAVRRLTDRDQDGVFDGYEVIATGLGWRGPQGLLVYGDTLYAVGGDGVQVFEGYLSAGPLRHRGRIGAKFNTGGDHDAHTLLRGHDGYIYLMAGNGSGIKDRQHINQDTSPCLVEREASVFRFSPDGTQWECIATGGRNPPSLGMNYLGDLFSFDSDMEWHVGLPWYRPVRLNHWIIGGDQGWYDVGAYPSYYLDNVPPVLEVGRGSPTSGRFYEHTQFPARYRDAFIVCDYRWKKESNDQYSTTGRLVAFFLTRDGAGWKATMETLARPKPGARDNAGKLLSFALVDAEVAPDGSLFITDHNQGIWRISYDPDNQGPKPIGPVWPAIKAEASASPESMQQLAEELINLPQAGAEWSRSRKEQLKQALGAELVRVEDMLFSTNLPVAHRLRSLQLQTSDGFGLSRDVLLKLAKDAEPEMRGQAAWLMGLQWTNRLSFHSQFVTLLRDNDPFVRRRAAEAMTRYHAMRAPAELFTEWLDCLADTNRLIAYTAMIALTHQSRAYWLFGDVDWRTRPPPARLRVLTAAMLRKSTANPNLQSFEVAIRGLTKSLLTERIPSRETRLDLLRVLVLVHQTVGADQALKKAVEDYLRTRFPSQDRDVRWEQVRVAGEYEIAMIFPKLLDLLEAEQDHVTQFHLAQAISKLSGGWSPTDEERLVQWFLRQQRGWFTEFAGKGVEFPDFWLTVLTDFGARHGDVLLKQLSKVDFTGQLGMVSIGLLAKQRDGDSAVLKVYRAQKEFEARIKILQALRQAPTPALAGFLRIEWKTANEDRMRGAILTSLAAQTAEASSLPIITEGLKHPDPQAVRACMEALPGFQPRPTEPLANLLIGCMIEQRSLFRPAYKALASLGDAGPLPKLLVDDLSQPIPDAKRGLAVQYWKDWYARQFNKPFAITSMRGEAEKSDESVHQFLLGDKVPGGNAANGAKIYEMLACNTCHGGGVTPGREGRLFGPELAGVTRRLSRAELADAIVYPSKQVQDRFKAVEIELKDATPLTGFVTEQNDHAVTLTDKEQVHRIPRSQIRAILPQSSSLMPGGLLNRLSWDELRDLMAFLDEGIAAIETSRQ